MTTRFGKYQLVDKIGAGGMAEVFLAKSVGAEGLEKLLVIKRILPDYAENRRFIEMFIAEAKIAMGLNHPNIVQIYDFGKVNQSYFLAMEYVDGFDLGQVLSACQRAGQPLPIGDAVYASIEIAKGLDYAHRRKDPYGQALDIVHRDISPQNLLVSRDGGLKVVDFGIAKATSVTEENPDVVKGKFCYMSPEQASGQPVDCRSDLFSLGVVIFEMVCGRPLFRQTTHEETLSLVKSAVVPDIASLNKEVPAELEGLLYKLLARRPTDRFQSARDLQLELTRVLYGLGEIHDAFTVAAHVQKIEGQMRAPDRSSSQKVSHPRTSRLRTRESAVARTSVMSTRMNDATPAADALGESGSLSTQLVAGDAGVAFGDTPVTPGLGGFGSDPDVIEVQARERKEAVLIAGELTGLLELREQLGQERWMQILHEYTRIVDSIAFKTDGVVHRVNENGFLILLGVPVSSENDAERAAQIALDLQEAITGINISLRGGLKMSIGIAIGEVLLEQEITHDGRQFSWSFYGTANELPERLARAALDKEILLGGQVWRRIKRGWRAEAVDTLRVEPNDGRPQIDVQGYRLLGPKAREEMLREVRHAYNAFYGRELPMKVMRDAFRQVLLDSQAMAFALVGAQGVGKSTLVEEFLAGVDPRVRIVRTVLTAFDRDVPMGCLASFLAQMLQLGPRDDIRQMRDTLRNRINALFHDASPGERELMLHSLGSLFNIRFGVESRFEQLDGDERRNRIFLSAKRLVLRFAEQCPLVMLIEDGHHIDELTLEFARDLFSSTRRAPAFFLVTLSDAIYHGADELWLSFASSRHVRVELLQELGPAEAEQMTRELLQVHQIEDERLVQEILRRSGGNPFYIKEVFEALRDRGALKDSGERRQIRGDRDAPHWLPASVEGLIGARVDRLRLDYKVALQKVSLLWSPFRGRDVEELLPEEVDEELLEALVRRHLLERVDLSERARRDTVDPMAVPFADRRYRFCNELTQEVVARSLLPEEARDLHQRIADYLITRNDEHNLKDSARIARHLLGAGDIVQARRYYYQAAEEAFDKFGAAEALRLVSKVVDAHEGGADALRLRALGLQAQAYRELGQRAEQQEALDATATLAGRIGTPAELGGVYLDLARFHYDQTDFRAARTFIERAAELAAAEQLPLIQARCLYTEALIDMDEGRIPQARQKVGQALELYRTGESREHVMGRSTGLNLMGVMHRRQSEYAQALACYEEALSVAREVRHGKTVRMLTLNVALALVNVGQFSEAVAHYESVLEEARSLGHRLDEAAALVNMGHAELVMGHLKRAVRHIQRGTHLARRVGSSKILADGQITLGVAYMEKGLMGEAERVLHDGLRVAESIPDFYLCVHAMLAQAQLRLTQATAQDARIALMQAEDALERSQASGMAWGCAAARAHMARAYKLMGHREQAGQLARQAIEGVLGTDMFSRDEILFYATTALPDSPDAAALRRQALEEARRVVLERRDHLDGEEARSAFLNRNINRMILQAAQIVQA